jgi:hypothetical protein
MLTNRHSSGGVERERADVMTDGDNELHGPLVGSAVLDKSEKDRDEDFARDLEDRCVKAVSKSGSGNLRGGFMLGLLLYTAWGR